MELKPGERTRQPRPHQWSVERRMQEQREPGSTESIVLAQVGNDNMIKLASTDNGKLDEGIYAAFAEAISLQELGVSEEDAALKISEKCGISLGSAVQIQEVALKKLTAHVSNVYSMEKEASDGRIVRTAAADPLVQEDAADLGLLEKKPEVPDQELGENPPCPQCGGPGLPLGGLGTKEHFSCRNCGTSFSRG